MLAVVTNYYNPRGSELKLSNFVAFKSQFKNIDLFTIEAAFGNDPFCTTKDEFTFHVRCRDYIWQQYRLINLISRKLPDKYDKIMWVDADILFKTENWFEQMSHELDSHKMVQSFSKVDFLDRNRQVIDSKYSVAWNALYRTNVDFSNFHKCLNMSSLYPTGFSWGVQREVMEQFGVYDYWITGSCDNAFVLGVWGDWNNKFFDRLNQDMLSHYMEWAVPFHNYINKQIGCIDCGIQHLWHGYRNYKKRWKCLVDFNPNKDIIINEQGVLEWSNSNKNMQECCKNMCMQYDIDFNILI